MSFNLHSFVEQSLTQAARPAVKLVRHHEPASIDVWFAAPMPVTVRQTNDRIEFSGGPWGAIPQSDIDLAAAGLLQVLSEPVGWARPAGCVLTTGTHGLVLRALFEHASDAPDADAFRAAMHDFSQRMDRLSLVLRPRPIA